MTNSMRLKLCLITALQQWSQPFLGWQEMIIIIFGHYLGTMTQCKLENITKNFISTCGLRTLQILFSGERVKYPSIESSTVPPLSRTEVITWSCHTVFSTILPSKKLFIYQTFSVVDPWQFRTDLDPRLWPMAPDPAIFVLDLQEAIKKLYFFLRVTFWMYIIIFLK